MRRIWIGCLASYNAGKLHGEWVDSEGLSLEELVDEMGEIDEDSLLARYFDLEAYTRDLFMSEYYALDSDDGVFVFRNQ